MKAKLAWIVREYLNLDEIETSEIWFQEPDKDVKYSHEIIPIVYFEVETGNENKI